MVGEISNKKLIFERILNTITNQNPKVNSFQKSNDQIKKLKASLKEEQDKRQNVERLYEITSEQL